MYSMKSIIFHHGEISLPKCMYHVRDLNECKTRSNENDINISGQVIKLIKVPSEKMAELEQRQDQLLKKLDILYDRIKSISSICTSKPVKCKSKIQAIPAPEEIVLNVNPDNLPWYLFVFLKDSTINVNISWHIHSSVSSEKNKKVQAYLKNFQNMSFNSKINLRLIFSSASTDSELKLSALSVPIVGNVNILRYLSLVYPNTVPYDYNDHFMDGLLDLCHMLEKTPEKNRDAIIQKILVQCKDWIYDNKFSIVDVALYNVLKQLRSKPKSVPSNWFERCQKICT